MTYGLTAAPMLIKKLKKKSKTHESDFVIDLGVDRLFRRIGLFGLSALAFVVKFMDSLEGAYLSCFPLNSNRRDDADLIKFSSSYCWDTSHILTNNGSCEKHSIPSFKTTQNPEQLKWLVHVLPYAMLVQALLLVGASSLWKSCFGAILKGDLHFLRLRLEDILNKDKVIQEGVYPGASFDEANASFDGMKGNFNGKKRGKNPSTSCTNEESGRQNLLDHGTESTNDSKCLKLYPINKAILGGMRDKHLFSMLCFENLQSLHYVPYLQSIFKRSREWEALPREDETPPKEDKTPPREDETPPKEDKTPPKEDETPPKEDKTDKTDKTVYLEEEIFKMWCHSKNMNGDRLILWYIWKHIIIGLATVAHLLYWSCICDYYSMEGWLNVESFRCELPIEDICMICVIPRKSEIHFIFQSFIFLMVCVFLFSFSTLVRIRFNRDRDPCCFFKLLTENSGAALHTANVKMDERLGERNTDNVNRASSEHV